MWPLVLTARLLIIQDTQCRTVHIVKLATGYRPEKAREASQTQPKRNWYEHRQAGHFAAPRSRSALATTKIDEPDMAAAASSGVT